MAAPHGWIWRITGWWIQPKSAREVMTLIGAIGAHSAGQHFAWRGMASADYALTSSLHRQVDGFEEDLRTRELDLLREARAWGLGVQPTGHVDDLQLLSDLQHYGIATRLIDFSSNPMTALWFASQQPKTGAKSGVLLALNITNWPRVTSVGSPNSTTYGELANPTGARLATALATEKPFIVESAHPNDRLRAQEGFFVASQVPDRRIWSRNRDYSMEIVTPFKSLALDYTRGDPLRLHQGLIEERGVGAPGNIPFVAIIISSAIKAKLLRYLEGSYNRTARVLFPDYAGFLQFGRNVREREGVA